MKKVFSIVLLEYAVLTHHLDLVSLQVAFGNEVILMTLKIFKAGCYRETD